MVSVADQPNGRRLISEETDWGLIDRDAETGEVAGVEMWHASKRLPDVFLDALPPPDGEPLQAEAARIAADPRDRREIAEIHSALDELSDR